MVESKFQIVFTYRCNLSCKWCDRHVDTLPWDDSDITSDEIILGAEMLKRSGVKNTWSKICGGEPLVHPEFEKLGKLVTETWSDNKKIPTSIYTNDQIKGPVGIGRYHKSGLPKKHQPIMISPKDVGLDPVFGYVNSCRVQNLCGRLFDAFGFAACSYAGIIGRILDYDFYQTRPVMLGHSKLCEHCIHSLPSRVRGKLQKKVLEGKLEHPTKTYREGIERNKDNPIILPRFQDRF